MAETDDGGIAAGAVQPGELARMEPPPQPWGFWLTMFFSALAIVAWFGVQMLGIGVLVAAGQVLHRTNLLEYSGLLLAVGTCLGLVADIGCPVLFAALRPGMTVRGYLHLRAPAKGAYFRWCMVILLFAAASDAVTTILDRPVIPESMYEAYTTAGWLPLLWGAIIVAAPLGEEMVFRGFMFEGLHRSPVGATGAILLPALVWSALHVQYDWYGIATVFVGGLILGMARLKTGSLYVPIFMHAVWGLVATVEMDIYVRIISG